MLSDRDLLDEIFGPDPESPRSALIDAFPNRESVDWNELPRSDPRWSSVESPVQPSSIDLHTGHIYVPGSAAGSIGSEERGALSHTLAPGHSVIVSTYEHITLPAYLGAIVFPPSRLSSKGILVANIGHIDPGFSGRLRFTIINMGATDFPLERGKDAVGTLLLFRLGTACMKSWRDRAGSVPKGEPTRAELESLSRDFANMQERVEQLARIEVKKEHSSFQLWSFLWPVIFGFAIAYGTTWYANGTSIISRIDSQQDAVSELRSALADTSSKAAEARAAAQIEIERLRGKLEDLERDNADLRARLPAP